MAQHELSEDERAELRRQIERLREEHRDLDAAIEALATPAPPTSCRCSG